MLIGIWRPQILKDVTAAFPRFSFSSLSHFFFFIPLPYQPFWHIFNGHIISIYSYIVNGPSVF